MELIDTHQHLMYRDQVGYSWANEFPPIDKGNFTLEDYKELTKDFKIKGNDGGSEITAVTFDMSEAGAATFNAGITATTGTFSGAISGTQLSINENIIFEGATANDFETTLTVTDPTADRTLTLPDETGTIATRGFAVAMAIAL